MEQNNLIIPRKLKGFWELMPKEQILFSSLLQKLEKVFQDNCFVPLDTPVLEYSDALLAKSGGETDKQVFRFEKGDADMCMRYDLTVPLARFVAMHKNELNFPFKRYQIGKVYRGERPQKGRFREFYQCDADIIGDGELSVVADAECVGLFNKCFKALDLDVEIRISNRKILAGFIESLNKTAKNANILIVLDKLDKISPQTAKAELQEIGLTDIECDKILNLAEKRGKIAEIVQNLRDFCSNTVFQTGLDELETLGGLLENFGCENAVCALNIIRGHDYYTGTVFEGFLSGTQIAVGGGGRFENLCSFFSKEKMPGVGMSVGITRLFDILMEQNYFDLTRTNEIDVAIANFDETLAESLKIATNLRENGVKADVFYECKSFKAKLKEANRRGIKFVLIVGEDEIQSQRFTLKDMENGTQEQLSLSEIVQKIKSTRM